MIQYRVEIKNLPELQQRFKQAPDITMRHLTTAGNQSLIALQGTAKGLSPIDTGRLRSSLLVSPMKRTGNLLSGSMGTSLQYAGIIEAGSGIYGPRKQPIRPKSGKYLTFK